MPQNLAKVVTKESVIAALEFFLKENPDLIASTKFDLIYKGKAFPPKEVIRKAAEIQKIADPDSYLLNGGDPTNIPLQNMGFQIETKGSNSDAISANEFIKRLQNFLESLQPEKAFGRYKFKNKNTVTSYSTPGGAWDPNKFPGFLFTDDNKKYLLRPINNGDVSYITIESEHLISQLINFNLTEGKTYVQKDGVTYIKESYLMTSGGRVAYIVVKDAMKKAGFPDEGIITSFEGTENFEQQVIEDLLKWAEIRERAKEIIREGPSHEEEKKDEPVTPTMKFPLNTILYGPPGTGKTYNTVLRAVEIITGNSYSGLYEEAKKKCNEMIGNGQIEFITFHQNYSYEEFVAGLRPDISGETGDLKFTEHKGVFYRICERAQKNYQDFNQYKAGRQYADPTFQEVLNEFLKPLIESDEPITLSTAGRNRTFKIDEINSKNLGFEKQGGSRAHTLSINTIKGLYEGAREHETHGLGIYMYPLVERLKKIKEEIKKPVKAIELKNFVIIIDEINRANISRVFGELITLLEPDKRTGAAHEIKVSLPGLPEEDKFSVPPNLYVLGTMNTADKSIALVDIALRRRFRFEPLYPDSTIPGVCFPEILDTINEQILAEKGADFLIGHSYFMEDENGEFNLVDSLNFKVIPLLNEYFYSQRGTSVSSIIGKAISGTDLQVESDKFGQLKIKKNP